MKTISLNLCGETITYIRRRLIENLVPLDIEIERTLREHKRNIFLEVEDMERARTDNVLPQVVNEEMNTDSNQIQNQEKEMTLEKC